MGRCGPGRTKENVAENEKVIVEKYNSNYSCAGVMFSSYHLSRPGTLSDTHKK